MDAASQEFIERMGLQFEADGMPRIAGRILGLLLLSEEPQSLDALSERLQVSKASASTNARLLERMGALERVGKPGDRRDYYRLDEGMPARMLEIRLERVSRLRDLVAEGLQGIGGMDPAVRKRLEGMERFHSAVVEELRSMLVRWRSEGSDSRRALVG